ncbi:hypothetical protein SAMN06265219_10713 [Gracilimonas mengyeensis]|uniref:Uncharacterized protein n=1 Tax=Gracilimonas mengyeensis TaxID=1302730 RepID=A0A521D0U5_9BACT|nr:hypothetical protein SAMN06265219_10713 [Gracilimonas mengyeensis]
MKIKLISKEQQFTPLELVPKATGTHRAEVYGGSPILKEAMPTTYRPFLNFAKMK